MEKEVKVTTIVDEEGTEYELEVIKEFDYNGKKYAVLFEEDACDCGDDCKCDADEKEACKCDDECSDDCDCDCHEDLGGHIYVLEVVKAADGTEAYEEVAENLMEELIPVVEKELYPTEQ